MISSDAWLLAEVAREAEAAGWDGFFLWDRVQFMPLPHVDAWVALTAVALATQRIRLGPVVTPLPRRRPVKLARETVSVDHISDGRLVLGVGIGLGPWEWDYMDEEPDQRVRGEMLDEALELLVKILDRRAGAPRRAVLSVPRRFRSRSAGGESNAAVAAAAPDGAHTDLGSWHVATQTAVPSRGALGSGRSTRSGPGCWTSHDAGGPPGDAGVYPATPRQRCGV